MRESEIEEGEACDYDDRNIDIDVALSYIDDKIQDILGQYQKDFEGGFSAETLGARFGGYGSFLPTYQRSPSIRSNPATHQKVQSHGTQAPSQVDQLVEGTSQNSTGSIQETVSTRPKTASRSAFPLPVAKPLPEDRLIRPEHSRDYVSDYEQLKGPVNQSDQKMLKVRIKLGSDDCLPVQKKSAIYSNLGLDMSPSSSSSSEDTDSPSEWERNFTDSLEEHMDSPSCIVRIMTSSPIHSGAMLSPLQDCLLTLSEQKDQLDHKRPVPVTECSAVWAEEKVPVEKQKKPSDRSVRLLELENEHACSKNESSIETSEGNHMLSEAGNHPPESKTTTVGKVAVGTGTIFNANVSGAKKELFNQKACKIHEASAKATLSGKVQKDKKLGCDPRDNGHKCDKRFSLFEDNDDMHEGMRKCRDGTLDRAKQKFEKKKASDLEDEMKVSHEEKKLSAGKKKPKGSKNNCSSTSGTSNNSMRIRLSAEPREKIFQKACKGDNLLLEDFSKVKGKHAVSIGDRNARNESKSHLLGTPVEDETRDYRFEVLEKEPLAFRDKSNVSSGDKKVDFLSTCKANLRGEINDVAPLALPSMEVAPYLIKENWVGCDKCHKWRLLPYGTIPDQLPQKWLCSMLDWLPGMNRCTISEEETTDALRALYRAGNHDEQLSHSVCSESSITVVNPWHDLDQNPQDLSFSGGKKKPKMIEVPHPGQHSVSKKQLNSTMKNEQVSIERRSLHNRSLSSSETKLDKRQGDGQAQKMKSKKEADQGGVKLSKKARTDGMHSADEDHNIGGISKIEIGSGNKKHPSYRNARCLVKDSTSLHEEKQHLHFQKTMDTEDQDKMGIEGKKRKSKGWMNSQVYPGNHSGNRQDNDISMEETSWSKCRKELKASKCKSEEKDTGASKGVCKLFGKDKMNYLSQSTVYDKNSEIRNLTDGLQCTAATSSSSLISSTCKFKINFQDIKGSPVESVCSSPLKISKRGSPGRNFPGNLDGADVGLSDFIGQSKCSGESVGVSNWSEALRKENAPIFAPIKEKSREIYKHNGDKVEKNFASHKVSSIKSLKNSNRGDDQIGCEGYEASPRKMNVVFQKDCKLAAQHNEPRNCSSGGSLDLLLLDTTNSVERAEGRRKSLDLLFLAEKKENLSWKSNKYDALEVGGSSYDDLARVRRQLRKDDGRNGLQDVVSNHIRNDFFSQVANDALEEVKDLKHSPDPLKISASGLQSAELFFQAALKFLHGASLFNPYNNNNAGNGEMTSAEMYGQAVKLCKYCAAEFERCNDSASAFLAYKCIEVAYMRVVYSNNLTASRDWNELQMALQRVSPAESPSSSDSDVENLNNEVKVEKRHITKDIGRSQEARDHVIPARNQPNFVRLLNFVEDVNLAMEASRKSQIAFAAAEINLSETGNMENISAIKKVLDVGFHDLERLLQLVRLAMESLRKTT